MALLWFERFDLNCLQECCWALVDGVQSTRDPLRVAQKCLHAVPLNLLEAASDDAEVTVGETDECDSFARSTIPRPGNSLRHARQIAHVHSLEALEDDSKGKVRCALLLSV